MSGALRGQMLDPLKMGLRAVVSHLMWILAIELASSARIVHGLNLSHVSMTLGPYFFKNISLRTEHISSKVGSLNAHQHVA